MGRLSGYRYRDVVAGIGSALHRRRLFLTTSLQLIATELADLAGGALWEAVRDRMSV